MTVLATATYSSFSRVAAHALLLALLAPVLDLGQQLGHLGPLQIFLLALAHVYALLILGRGQQQLALAHDLVLEALQVLLPEHLLLEQLVMFPKCSKN